MRSLQEHYYIDDAVWEENLRHMDEDRGEESDETYLLCYRKKGGM